MRSDSHRRIWSCEMVFHLPRFWRRPCCTPVSSDAHKS